MGTGRKPPTSCRTSDHRLSKKVWYFQVLAFSGTAKNSSNLSSKAHQVRERVQRNKVFQCRVPFYIQEVSLFLFTLFLLIGLWKVRTLLCRSRFKPQSYYLLAVQLRVIYSNVQITGVMFFKKIIYKKRDRITHT